MKQKVLIVDDEPDVIELLKYNLRQAGFDIETATDGLDGLRKARETSPDLILLDVMLPQIDGLDICKLLRRDAKTSAIPIIMLTARASENDRVLGLELGADDYVTKPFSPRELVLRVKNLLRRGQPADKQDEIVQFGDLRIDVPRHKITFRNKPLELTATEFKLVTILAQRRGLVQSREQLLREVWQYDVAIDTRTVDTHVRRLREKLGEAAKYLDTVRGVGYRFVE